MLKESKSNQSSSETQRELSQQQVNSAARKYAEKCQDMSLKSMYNNNYFIYMLHIRIKFKTQHNLQPQNKNKQTLKWAEYISLCFLLKFEKTKRGNINKDIQYSYANLCVDLAKSKLCNNIFAIKRNNFSFYIFFHQL